ncbi:MAG: gamma-glutamyl-gamma-aminobutyrate hydrolase family protein, partial [Lachnospiraceae bacterium]|nr:gamma-glutamyl-gamma-aminobutyrate hydrolase family protein [Lachnospiraceae bacterium]
MAKPKIAVVPLWDDEKESVWMLPGYMDGIRDVGALPVMLPLSGTPEDMLGIFELCDGLLMTGGNDVSPALYHQEKKESCGQNCPARDRIENEFDKISLRKSQGLLTEKYGYRSHPDQFTLSLPLQV